MKHPLSPLLLLALLPAAASADYVLNDFETSSAPWSTGTIKTAYATSGTNSLRITLPASDMWYCSSTIIDVAQYTTEQRQAAFTDATKLIIDFTVGTYSASWMNDHHVGFILQGTGAENDWVSLGSQKWDGIADTTTAEIAITPAQAAILASDPAAKLFLYADYGNGSDMGIQLYVDTFRTDADGVFSLPLALMGAQIESSTTIALLCDDDVDAEASADATVTLQPTTGGAVQTLTVVGNGDKPEIVIFGVPSALSAGTSYTLTVSGLKGVGAVEQKEQAQFTVSMGATVSLSVDSLSSDHRISPYIYGLSFAPSVEYMRRAGITVNRWGGNAVSAFNWELNVTNRAADWYFLNSNMTAPEDYIADDAAAGALTQWTLPCLPWVSKDNTSYCFSVAKYGEQEAVNPYNSDAGNGKTTAGVRIINDFTDALVPNRASPSPGDDATTVYQDEFLRHMDDELGGFTRKVPFIAMDNEVDIWDGTHAEAMHDKMSYDSIVSYFTTFAAMTRQEIPDAQIFGPVSTGWYYYWNSAKGGERASHGGLGFIPWFLQQVKAHDDAFGQRTLDVLDLHFYPEACTTSNGDATIDLWRMRATRELWAHHLHGGRQHGQGLLLGSGRTRSVQAQADPAHDGPHRHLLSGHQARLHRMEVGRRPLRRLWPTQTLWASSASTACITARSGTHPRPTSRATRPSACSATPTTADAHSAPCICPPHRRIWTPSASSRAWAARATARHHHHQQGQGQQPPLHGAAAQCDAECNA
jgi:hypothetical protein